ncbi:MAG: NADH-quinone oxidoreductase subunit K [Pseudomonadales bacterium]|jgi:multicomponent Na+:H+ antiporter subunit C|nr:NADH-quinone oxidoreductase subunit K [Pseudomonadales bacterium]
MSPLLAALVVGALFAAGLRLLLERSIVRLILGLALIGNAVNLLVFTAAGTLRDAPPLVALGEGAPAAGHADPLPQALVLTAIVIGFALVSFTAVLVYRAYSELGTDDLDEMRRAEP